jgi:tRNA(Ile)-lysidine synthase
LRRAREALDYAAEEFLAAYSEVNAGGYAVIDREAVLSAPQEIALRALSRLIAIIGGAEEPLRLAKLETLLAALAESPPKARTLGHCRIQPISGRLGIFREVRAKGLPVIRVLPGERTLWDNRFRIELGRNEHEPITVRALGEQGLRELRDSSTLLASLPRLAGRTLPSCWRGDSLIGVPALGSGQSQVALDCRATFVSGDKRVERLRF